jgi:hypothetical protein
MSFELNAGAYMWAHCIPQRKHPLCASLVMYAFTRVMQSWTCDKQTQQAMTLSLIKHWCLTWLWCARSRKWSAAIGSSCLIKARLRSAVWLLVVQDIVAAALAATCQSPGMSCPEDDAPPRCCCCCCGPQGTSTVVCTAWELPGVSPAQLPAHSCMDWLVRHWDRGLGGAHHRQWSPASQPWLMLSPSAGSQLLARAWDASPPAAAAAARVPWRSAAMRSGRPPSSSWGKGGAACRAGNTAVRASGAAGAARGAGGGAAGAHVSAAAAAAVGGGGGGARPCPLRLRPLAGCFLPAACCCCRCLLLGPGAATATAPSPPASCPSASLASAPLLLLVVAALLVSLPSASGSNSWLMSDWALDGSPPAWSLLLVLAPSVSWSAEAPASSKQPSDVCDLVGQVQSCKSNEG